MTEQRKGWRCPVCTGCGRCFEETRGERGNAERAFDDVSEQGGSWDGQRCEVCVSCGKCAAAWGLTKKSPDTVTGATNWASGFKALDNGRTGEAPKVSAAPGVGAAASADVARDAKGASALHGASDIDGVGGVVDDEVDTVTGATPGVASACKELGLDSLEAVTKQLNIKPPGIA